jgi:DNA-binding NarL/FixJ family response regulator
MNIAYHIEPIVISQQETEVLKLVSFGLSTHEIAHRLIVCETIVDSRRRTLMHKIGAHNMLDVLIETRDNTAR